MKIKNREAGFVVDDLIMTIQQNKDYLSEIDGKIGDGDHGINMNKGFTMCQDKLKGRTYSLSEGLKILSETLMDDIGGSMGPLYGVFFEEASISLDKEDIDSELFEKMLNNSIDAVQSIGNAKIGDKTLLDTLIPAHEGFKNSLKKEDDFYTSLEVLKDEAYSGWKSTENMTAKIGRASRLGERSKGVLDAGATSCYLILNSMAKSIQKILVRNYNMK